MAFASTLSCWQSCNISVNGNAETVRSEREEVCLITS